RRLLRAAQRPLPDRDRPRARARADAVAPVREHRCALGCERAPRRPRSAAHGRVERPGIAPLRVTAPRDTLPGDVRGLPRGEIEPVLTTLTTVRASKAYFVGTWDRVLLE